jgi:hypothetical protein
MPRGLEGGKVEKTAAPKNSANLEQRVSIARGSWYAVLSLAFLCIAIVVGKWVFEHADRLGPNFNFAYYGALVILAASMAIVLFGSMRSYAHLTRTQGSMKMELGGPSALFALLVLGGFWLAKPEQYSSMTVRLLGEGLETVAVNELEVTLDLASNRDRRPFNSSGEAVFPNIPTSLINQEVRVYLNNRGAVRLKQPAEKVRIPSDLVLYLEVLVEDPRRTAAREKISELRKLMRMTLISQNESLSPAFEAFMRKRSDQNWADVQKAAKKLLTLVDAGVQAALEYDASFGPSISEIQSIAQGEGMELLEIVFTSAGPRRVMQTRGAVLDDVVKSQPPSIEQAREWMARLKTVYEKLEASLTTVERHLESPLA